MSAGIPKNDTNDRTTHPFGYQLSDQEVQHVRRPAPIQKIMMTRKTKAVGGTDRLIIISVTIGFIACKNLSICRKVNGAAVSRIRRSMCNSDEAWKIWLQSLSGTLPLYKSTHNSTSVRFSIYRTWQSVVTVMLYCHSRRTFNFLIRAWRRLTFSWKHDDACLPQQVLHKNQLRLIYPPHLVLSLKSFITD